MSHTSAESQRCGTVPRMIYASANRQTHRSQFVRLQLRGNRVRDLDLSTFAPPEESTPSHSTRSPESLCRRRLWWIFALHLSSVVLGFVVARNEEIFSGGRLFEFFVMAPIVVGFYLCPIAVILTVKSASHHSLLLRLAVIVVDLSLSILQIVSLLPLVQ